MHIPFFKPTQKHALLHIRRVFNPHKEWKILLGIFFSVLSVLILVNLYLLYQIRTEQTGDVKASINDTPTLLKEDLLKKTLSSFDEKAKKGTDIIKNVPTYRDPNMQQ